MAIAFDALSSGTGTGGGAGGSGITVSHTAVAGAMVVAIVVQRYPYMTSITVTHDGNAMTLRADSGYDGAGSQTRTLIYTIEGVAGGAKNVVSAWTGTVNNHMVVISYTGATFDDSAIGADTTSQFNITVNSENGGLGVGGFSALHALEGVNTERYDALKGDVHAVVDELAATGATVTLGATGTSNANARQAAVSLSPATGFVPRTQFLLSLAGLAIPAAMGGLACLQ